VTSEFKVGLVFSDSTPRQVAVYLLDWDRYAGGRGMRVEIVDAGGVVLDSRSVTDFSGGQYLVWNLSGRVSPIRFAAVDSSWNAVVSGIFFGGA
jgi:hypothetical protein